MEESSSSTDIPEQLPERSPTPSSFQSSEPTESSSEEELLNRALANSEVQGYDIYGRVIELPKELEPGERLKQYEELARDPSLLYRRVLDKSTGKYVELTPEQLEKLEALISRNRTFSNINLTERPELKFIDRTYQFSIFSNTLPTKSQFVKREELHRQAFIARQIAQGKLDPDDLDGYKKKLKEKKEKEATANDVWEHAEPLIQYQSKLMSEHQAIRLAPAPKMTLPMTQESYNPPDEYLAEGETKPATLRQLKPATDKLIMERFQRQLDLFLAPRQRRAPDFTGSSEEYLRQQLQTQQKLMLRPYPLFCDIIIRGASGRVNSVAVSPNGRFIASGGKDGILRVYELETGKLLRQLVLIPNEDTKKELDTYYGVEINCVRFSPNKQVSVLAAAVGNQVVFIDLGLSMGLSLQETKLNTRNLLNLDISKARPLRGWSFQCIQGTVSHTPQGVDVQNQDLEKVQREEIDRMPERIADPRLERSVYQRNHEGGLDNTTVYSVLNDEILLRIHSPNVVHQVDFHSKGDYFLTLSKTHERRTNLAIHRLSTAQSTAPFEKALPLQAALFSPTSSSIVLFEQTTGYSFNLKSLQRENYLHPHAGQIQAAAINAESGDLIATSARGTAVLFRFAAGPEPDSKNAFSQIATTCVAARNNLVAVGGEDGVVQVLRIIDGRLYSCTALIGHGVKNQHGVRGVAWGPSGELVTCAGDGTIRVWR